MPWSTSPPPPHRAPSAPRACRCSSKPTAGATTRPSGSSRAPPGYTLLVTPTGTNVLLETRVADVPGARTEHRLAYTTSVRTTLVGAEIAPEITGIEPAPTRIHHIRGADPEAWSLDNPTYTRIRYREPWPGIDLVLYDAGGQLEYDFVVAPGADPASIRIAYEGVDALALRDDGALILRTPSGDIEHSAPVIFQQSAGVREPVTGRFVLLGESEVGFEIDAWDATRPLVIDPVMVYASLIGGATVDIVHDVAADASGRAYVVGETLSADLPVTAGALDGTLSDRDAFVACFSDDGTSLEWCTYLGGTSPVYFSVADDWGYTIEVDDAGLVYVGGSTSCGDFPTTADAIELTQTQFTDGFVSILSNDGSSLVYSTLLGGAFTEEIYDLCVTDAGRVYITGQTDGGFPVTPDAFQPVVSGGAPRDGFFAWFTPGGPLEYSSHLAGPSSTNAGYAIEVDASNRVYVAGSTFAGDFPTTPNAFQGGLGGSVDGFLCRFDPSGTTLEYSTYLGGPNNDHFDSYVDIDVTDDGRVCIVGTARKDYPTSSGAFQESSPTIGPETFGCGVLTCLDTDLAGPASMVYSTFLGSWPPSGLSDVELDDSGNAWVYGWADGADFPTLAAWDDEIGYGPGNDFTDAVLACFSPSGALLSSTFVGGSGLEPNQFAPRSHGGFDIGPDGTLFLAQTQSAGGVGLPTPGANQVTGAGGTDSWIARFIPDDPVCQTNLGFDGPGDGTLTLCGGELDAGTFAVLRLSGFEPGLVQLVVGLSNDPAYVSALDATLVPLPILTLIPVFTDTDGDFEAYVPGGLGPVTVYLQATQPDNPSPGQWTTSNALSIQFQP